jgi:hypothetical protein
MNRPTVESIQQGVWTPDIAKYPDNDIHRSENLELYEFEYNGYKCHVKRNMFYCWCGYVDLLEPINDELLEGLDELINVNGGLTFKTNQKLGFDCSHGTDIQPTIVLQGYALKMPSHAGATYKDYDFIITDTKQLVDQLIALNQDS